MNRKGGLKLLSYIDLPQLRSAVAALADDIEFIAVPPQGAVPPHSDGDALLTFTVGISNLEELLSTVKSLRWIHVFGTGIDNFPIHLVGNRLLTIGRGITAVPMAEWAMAMLLSAVKNLPASWITAHQTTWHLADLNSLAGQTLAIAGYGTIGRALAVRAKAFDMRIRALTYHMRSGSDGVVDFADDWAGLVKDADHVVLALPLTAATRNFVDAGKFAACKPGTHLINIARGAIVDQDALRAALDSGRIGLASLDTVSPEPLPPEHWLYSHSRVRLSPHISWSAPGILASMQQFYLENLARFYRGETLQGSVDTASGY